jgi:predicted nucleotidyltransferase
MDRIRADLRNLRDHEVVLHGSVLAGTATPRSDVDVAVLGGTFDARANESLWWRLLGAAPDRYDVRVFELLPLPVQVRIAEAYAVVFGDPVAISYAFYGVRRRWKDQARRHAENQFASFQERYRLLRAHRTQP